MKWLLFIALVICILIILIFVIGLFIPRSHRATRKALFKQSPETIFAAIYGPQDWRDVTTTALPPHNGCRMWRETSGRFSITLEEASADPPHRYVTRNADKDLPFAGTWTYELTPTPNGCICRITEDGEVSNPFFRVISLLKGHTATIESTLRSLARKFEEPVTIEP